MSLGAATASKGTPGGRYRCGSWRHDPRGLSGRLQVSHALLLVEGVEQVPFVPSVTLCSRGATAGRLRAAHQLARHVLVDAHALRSAGIFSPRVQIQLKPWHAIQLRVSCPPPAVQTPPWLRSQRGGGGGTHSNNLAGPPLCGSHGRGQWRRKPGDTHEHTTVSGASAPRTWSVRQLMQGGNRTARTTCKTGRA
jgi:hypothetical protein